MSNVYPATSLNMIRSDFKQKPMPHTTWDQWESANRNMEKITQMRNHVSNHVRQLAQQLRNATENTVRWQLSETNNRMADRISDVEQWYKDLERTLEDLKDQTQRLSEAKVSLESSICDLLPLQEVVEEVILLRDRRREIDLAEDEPYREARKEEKLMKDVEAAFRDLAQQAFMELLALKEQKDKLLVDLKRKAKALDIDNYKLSLTPESIGNISYKPFPLEISDDSVDVATWLRNCLQLKRDTERLVTGAMQKTNDIWGLMKTKLDDVKKQREVTQRALRKRLHETAQTRDKLGIQRKQLMDEIDKLDREMKDMEKAISDKSGFTKLVQTRFENRKWRPGMELCRDVTQDSLKKELDHVTKSKEILEQHLRDIKNTLNGLRHQLHLVEEDLERKERSLALENACLESHTNPPKAPYQQELGWRAPVTSLEFSAHVGEHGFGDGHAICAKERREVSDASTMTVTDGDKTYLIAN